jgi:hypothetical protein
MASYEMSGVSQAGFNQNGYGDVNDIDSNECIIMMRMMVNMHYTLSTFHSFKEQLAYIRLVSCRRIRMCQYKLDVQCSTSHLP